MPRVRQSVASSHQSRYRQICGSITDIIKASSGGRALFRYLIKKIAFSQFIRASPVGAGLDHQIRRFLSDVYQDISLDRWHVVSNLGSLIRKGQLMTYFSQAENHRVAARTVSKNELLFEQKMDFWNSVLCRF